MNFQKKMTFNKNSFKLLCLSRNLVRRGNPVFVKPKCSLNTKSTITFSDTAHNNVQNHISDINSNSTPTATTPEIRRIRETIIQTIGNKKEYDAVKQFRLIELPDDYHPQPNLLASMHVKRNIIFGTRIHDREYLQLKGQKQIMKDVFNEEDSDVDENSSIHLHDDNYHNFGFVKVCKPLLKACLIQAGVEGDQPQGLAALNGLSARVKYLLDNPTESVVMKELMAELSMNDSNNYDCDNSKKIAFDAMVSITTQTPRKGNDNIGLGTYLDARPSWTLLAKEYALSRKGKMVKQGEAQLFQSYGAVFVGIDYIGEENPNYWIDAGGAMARFFFV